MINKFTILFITSIILISCSKNDEIQDNNRSFPILSYDAEISETLNLDTSNIAIEQQEKIFGLSIFKHQIT